MSPARSVVLILSSLALFVPYVLADRSDHSVPVRRREGTLHGFLAGRAVDGAILAAGDLVQTVDGDRVTNDLTFHFLDGSMQREIVVFEQKQKFRLISDKVTQKGNAFPKPFEWTYDAATGHVKTTSTDDKGQPVSTDKKVDVGPDVGNGLLPTLLQNVTPAELPLKVPYLAGTADGRRVVLEISAEGEERCLIAGVPRTATRYTVHVNIGGLTGFIAPLVGKQPSDSHIWILNGPAPAFLKSEMPLYNDGPMWRVELASPSWPVR